MPISIAETAASPPPATAATPGPVRATDVGGAADADNPAAAAPPPSFAVAAAASMAAVGRPEPRVPLLLPLVLLPLLELLLLLLLLELLRGGAYRSFVHRRTVSAKRLATACASVCVDSRMVAR